MSVILLDKYSLCQVTRTKALSLDIHVVNIL